MKKRSMRLALCLALALALMAGAPAAAAAWDDVNSLAVTLNDTYREDLAKDLEPDAQFPVTVDLYMVAEGTDWTGYDAFYFEAANLKKDFEGLKDKGFPTDRAAMEDMDNEKWTELAHAAAALVLSPEGEGTPASLLIQPEPGLAGLPLGTETAGAAGELTAKDLPSGLYLVLAHGKDAKPEDYITTVKAADGTLYPATTVSSQEYVYTFQPMLVTLPEQVLNAEGLTTGEWNHAIAAALKPQRVDRNGRLTIVKGIDVYDRDEPATFVFRVTAVKGKDESGNDKTVYSNVFSLTFDSSTPTSQEIVIEDIPVGATVTVKEEYSGASYTLTGEQVKVPGQISASGDLRVEFENVHGPDHKQGHGVLNEFTVDAEGTWKWNPVYPGTYLPAEPVPESPEA